MALKLVLMLGVLLCLATGSSSWAQPSCNAEQVVELKAAILKQAKAFAGQGDPDGSKQAALDVLVDRLIKTCPQPPAKERLGLIEGAWQQVWGPYTYRDDARGVDPTLNPDHIYQVVFKEGYYYNVSPNRNGRGEDLNKTTLLRGEYTVDPNRENVLNVQFTNLKGVPGTPPKALQFTQLPHLAETRQLPGLSSTLPGLFVRLFFGGGALREVYTDADLRITYGSSRNRLEKNYLYILKRVGS